MKQFTMSMFMNKEDMYKAKAEYLEGMLEKIEGIAYEGATDTPLAPFCCGDILVLINTGEYNVG